MNKVVFLGALLIQSAGFLLVYHKYSELQADYREQVELTQEEYLRNLDLVKVVDMLNDSLTIAQHQLLGTKHIVNGATNKLRNAEAMIKQYMDDAERHQGYSKSLEKELANKKEQQKQGSLMQLIMPPAAGHHHHGGHGHGRKFLCFAIPTVPRRNGERYLEMTVNAIIRQLPSSHHDPMYGSILVLVCNNRPGQHPLFSELKYRIEESEHRDYFMFVEHDVSDPEPLAHADAGEPNKPGWRVRQQTRELVSLLREAKDLADHYMFMEDDFELCPHAMRALHYAIEKTHDYVNDWVALRVSYGMCGIIIRGKDIGFVADYLEQHAARRPPDHLVPELIMSETAQSRDYLRGRRNAGYRYVLMHHIGKVSAIREQESPDYPACYTPLVYPVIFENEGWRENECGSDDIWPCNRPHPRWPKEIIQFNKL